MSHCQSALYLDKKKGTDEQPIPFLFSNPQNLGMLLIGRDLNNKNLLIGENDAHYLGRSHVPESKCPPLRFLCHVCHLHTNDYN